MQETPTISSGGASADTAEPQADRRLLIDGALLETARTFPSINPATGEVLGHAPDATVADAEAAIAAARRAFDTTDWSTNTELRIRCLEQFHQALIDHRDELAALTTAEVGATPALIAGPQLDQPIDIVRYYAELLKTYPMTEDLGNIESRGMQHHRWVEKEAGGVVAAIIAYNYPNQLALAKLAPALAAGCTVILKGAPDTPLVTLALGELIANHTDIPAGVVNVLSGADPEVGAVLTTSADVDMVTFTGSTPTGRRIMAAASETLKKVFLELGGKSAAIVLDDADFSTAAMFSAFSMVSHAGQGCALTSRLLVPRKHHDEIVELVKNNFGLVRYGDPSDPNTYMGPLISEKQRDKVDGMVKRAVDAGATLVTGGEKVDPGYFYTPTLLTNVDPDSEIAQEEVFGPVLVVLTYEDDDDAVRIANNSIYGLSGAVFGGQDRALALARRIRTGHVLDQRRQLLQPRQPVRRLQAVRHRQGDGHRGTRGVPGVQDVRDGGRMSKPLEGIRVLEVAMYGFVPSAGAVLGEWGADVIKVEHAVTGDPQRGLRQTGLLRVEGDPNPNIEHANRGKRSIGLDMSVPEGKEVLLELARRSDVFLTSFLPGHRQKFGIDVDDIRAVNPKIIYARGSALGPRGEESVKGGYDMTAFWCRAGTAATITPPGMPGMIGPPGPAYGDTISGTNLAGGITAALLKRERTGEPSVVDVSLLGSGLWSLGHTVALTKHLGQRMEAFPPGVHGSPINPLVGLYPTADDRYISFVMMQPTKFWADVCRHMDLEDLADDPRFATVESIAENTEAAAEILKETMSKRPLAEWSERFATLAGPWAPVQDTLQAAEDAQIRANEYLVQAGELELVANPVQFDVSRSPNRARTRLCGAN